MQISSMTHLKILLLLLVFSINTATTYAVPEIEEVNRGGFHSMHLNLGANGYYGPIFIVNEDMKKVSEQMALKLGIRNSLTQYDKPNNNIMSDRQEKPEKKRYTQIISYSDRNTIQNQHKQSFSQIVTNHRTTRSNKTL